MGKVEIVGVVRMEGCERWELYWKGYKEVGVEDWGMKEIREKGVYDMRGEYWMCMVEEWGKWGREMWYVGEVSGEKGE